VSNLNVGIKITYTGEIALNKNNTEIDSKIWEKGANFKHVPLGFTSQHLNYLFKHLTYYRINNKIKKIYKVNQVKITIL